jgi:hypothetical protein
MLCFCRFAIAIGEKRLGEALNVATTHYKIHNESTMLRRRL